MDPEESETLEQDSDLAAIEDVEDKARFDDREAEVRSKNVSVHHEAPEVEEQEDALENKTERLEDERKKAKRRKKGTL